MRENRHHLLPLSCVYNILRLSCNLRCTEYFPPACGFTAYVPVHTYCTVLVLSWYWYLYVYRIGTGPSTCTRPGLVLVLALQFGKYAVPMYRFMYGGNEIPSWHVTWQDGREDANRDTSMNDGGTNHHNLRTYAKKPCPNLEHSLLDGTDMVVLVFATESSVRSCGDFAINIPISLFHTVSRAELVLEYSVT
jgi:hypothetical protein